MKLKIFICFLLFITCLSTFAKQKRNNHDQFSRIQAEIAEGNKRLPVEQANGIWLWSIVLDNNRVCTYTFKISQKSIFPIYKSVEDLSFLGNLIDQYLSQTILKSDNGKSIKFFIDNNIGIKFKFLLFEDNTSIYEKELSPKELEKEYLKFKNNKFEGHRPLSYYKEGFEAQKSVLLRDSNDDDVATFFDVSMIDNDLYHDYYIDDIYASDAYFNTLAEELSSSLKAAYSNRNLVTKEFVEDLITYKIKFHYRYYSKSSKKLIKEIVINCSDIL